MKPQFIIGGTALLALTAAGAADGASVAPLPQRDGVVVSWQAGSKTALVSTKDGRTYVIHGLRKVKPGTRVRVEGIKWGKPTRGIKWSRAPRGIKWGIKWARNGTYQSKARVIGRSNTMSLRATVVRRSGRSNVVVAVPGATVTLPLARGAVWLPNGKRTKSLTRTDGRRVMLNLRVDARGRVQIAKVRPVAANRPAPTMPVAGRVIAVDPVARTVTIRGEGAGAVATTIALPAGADPTKITVGLQVTGVAVRDPGTGELTISTLGLNGSFTAADTIIIAPDPSAAPAPAAGGNPTPAKTANEAGGTGHPANVAGTPASGNTGAASLPGTGGGTTDPGIGGITGGATDPGTGATTGGAATPETGGTTNPGTGGGTTDPGTGGGTTNPGGGTNDPGTGGGTTAPGTGDGDTNPGGGGTTDPGTGGGTTDPGTGGDTTDPGTGGGTNPGGGTTDPGTGGGTTDPGTGGGTNPGGGTSDPGTGGGTTDPGTGGGTTDPGTGDGTTNPGTGDGTTNPGGGTNDPGTGDGTTNPGGGTNDPGTGDGNDNTGGNTNPGGGTNDPGTGDDTNAGGDDNTGGNPGGGTTNPGTGDGNDNTGGDTNDSGTGGGTTDPGTGGGTTDPGTGGGGTNPGISGPTPTQALATVSTSWNTGWDDHKFTGVEGTALYVTGVVTLQLITADIAHESWGAARDKTVALKSLVAHASSSGVDGAYRQALMKQLTDLQVTLAKRQ